MYSYVLRNAVLPLHDALRQRRYSRYHALLCRSQWWSREQLLDFQWTELQRLLKAAFQTRFYRAKYAAVGASAAEDIRSLDDFAGLPILDRAEIQQHLEDMYPRGATQARLPHSTGGSSGTPLRFYRTIDSYAWRMAATHRAYAWSGFEPGDRSVHLWGAPLSGAQGLSAIKSKLFDALYRKTIIPTFLQTEALWKHVHSQLVSIRPAYVVGYASSLVAFARYALDKGLNVPAPRALISGADQLDDQARGLVEEAFRARVFNTYGSREFMSIAGECDQHRGMHVNAENILVENTAGPGTPELLVTDLHNYGTLFIRYAIGDLGEVAHDRCSCGRELPTIRAIEGRAREAMAFSSGQTVSALFFRHILKEIPEILEYQVRQIADDEIVVRAVLARPISPDGDALFRSECSRLPAGVTIRIEPVTAIAREPNGKLKAVIPLRGHGVAGASERA